MHSSTSCVDLICINIYFLATLLENKKPSSTNMDDGDQDADPMNIIDIKYNELPEEQRRALETQLKEIEAESKKRLVSCFGRPWQGVVEKEKFVMPMFLSNATSSVSNPLSDLANQFGSIIGDKIPELNNLLLNLTNQMHVLTKGKAVDHSYSTMNLKPSSSAKPPPTS